jgi:hypothetical protein
MIAHSFLLLQALCMDILGTLRRSLTQQIEVRAALYSEVMRLSDLAPFLRENLVHLLQSHVCLYFCLKAFLVLSTHLFAVSGVV